MLARKWESSIRRTTSSDPWGIDDMSALIKDASLLRTRNNRQLDIALDDHYVSKVYTSGSSVSGTLTITPRKNIRFESVQITLVGRTRLRCERGYVTTLSSHEFLKLVMPIPEDAYPESKVFQSGKAYEIPFFFIIPTRLAATTCSHSVESDVICDYHMRLPSTMGGWERDDMAPDMSRITYTVEASIMENIRSGEKALEFSKDISVIPSAPEDPPLNVKERDMLYKLRKSKLMRKNMLSRASGRVSAGALQPAAVHLSPDGRRAEQFSIPVSLTFEPTAADDVPPQVTATSAKLQAQTWYTGQPMRNIPSMGVALTPFKYTKSLGQRPLDNVTWTRNVASPAQGETGDSSKSAVFYTTTLQVPLDLSTLNNTLLPTFHSCLVSRTYTVKLYVSVGGLHMNLAVPLQVALESQEEKRASIAKEGSRHILPEFEAVVSSR